MLEKEMIIFEVANMVVRKELIVKAIVFYFFLRISRSSKTSYIYVFIIKREFKSKWIQLPITYVSAKLDKI